MPTTNDFRGYAFDPGRVDAAGKNVGQKVYWKLYVIENLVRVMAHSILTVQVGTNWWTVAVDPGIQAAYNAEGPTTPTGRGTVHPESTISTTPFFQT